MFLRCHERKKNGKEHRYWSVVESRRLDNGKSAQRQVLYLGEINDSQEAAWRKSIAIFDEDGQSAGEACLFPDDRHRFSKARIQLLCQLSSGGKYDNRLVRRNQNC